MQFDYDSIVANCEMQLRKRPYRDAVPLNIDGPGGAALV